MKKIKDFINNFFSKKTIDISELENKYLNFSNKSKMYSFQEKFMNQQNLLYEIFGNANSTILKKVKLIIVSDTHNTLNEEKLIDLINKHPDYDLCLLLGDHSRQDIEKILRNIKKDKIYALLGNHDSDYIDYYALNNLNGQIIDINGVKFLGIEGSFRYKPVNFPSFTQEESIAFLKDKQRVDVLVSHDGPFYDENAYNPAHQGLFGITYYLFKNKVKYNIHGHFHDEYRNKLINGTTEISLYGINYIELN